ncbi:hypothetical protein Vlu01_10210 [Micromonospora lutea]|uniref:Uncharacterized protein n=1 Tax=Micromonospora lutea TaxID=419825 RepID=A0ABQ4IR36_9ACTN|nr:hypothetical protein Vlu01_10210 [Micromonospora lutea]
MTRDAVERDTPAVRATSSRVAGRRAAVVMIFLPVPVARLGARAPISIMPRAPARGADRSWIVVVTLPGV